MFAPALPTPLEHLLVAVFHPQRHGIHDPHAPARAVAGELLVHVARAQAHRAVVTDPVRARKNVCTAGEAGEGCIAMAEFHRLT